ncbi:MAG: hypothetical protein IJX63_11555 [Lachnospiraceae bacterium]|nr:hypothetical protein [Lachnospiraceae bacterium]
MKRFIIKAIVFVLTFVAAVVVISKIMNRDNNSLTKDMAEPSLPIVCMQTGDMVYNELHGIVGDSNVIYQRDTMTVLGTDRDLKFLVELYDTKISKLAMEVRSCDGSRLIEDTELDYTIKNHKIYIDTSVKDLIEQGEEYALVVVITDENDREIRYYTRIVWKESLYAAEKLAFVKEFHEKTFDSEQINDLVKYMESNSKGNNTTLHKVDIHSSLKQVGWGELDVKPMGDPVLNLKEIAGQTASVELKRVVSTGYGKKKAYYFVTEVYRIRYTTDRVYLLDFERTMTQIPNYEADIYDNNKIYLGIVPEDTPLLESEDGNIVVFEAANRLCSYNITTNKMALLFSFYDEDHTDARSIYDRHTLKILDVDEGGNVQFAVYGYMNRGRHEGEIGIQLYAYDSEKNTIEETIYIPYEKSYEILHSEIENLLYWNRDGVLYMYLNHTIYAVNTIEKTMQKLAVMENDESIDISANHRIAVWHEGDDLKLMNLNLQTQVTLEAKTGERLYPLGFMEEDLIYGMAKQEDIAIDSVGRTLVPMYKVCICDSKGKPLKEYEQENIYMTTCTIEGNQITLERIERMENGNFKEIGAEHIMNNVEIETGKNKLAVAAIDVYERVVQVEVRSTIDDKTIQILTPGEVVFEGARNTELELVEFENQYYVYDSFGVAGVYMSPATALKTAYENSGVVMDESGKTIWIKGNRVTKNQIMAIKEQSVTEEKNSLAVCLDTILKFEGITLNSEELLAEGMSAQRILQENLSDVRVVDLSGCNLDTVLYFVNQDIPVLANLYNGESVLVVGFNQYNVVIMEPSTGKLYKKGINDSAAWFEENGNHFITYFRLEE